MVFISFFCAVCRFDFVMRMLVVGNSTSFQDALILEETEKNQNKNKNKIIVYAMNVYDCCWTCSLFVCIHFEGFEWNKCWIENKIGVGHKILNNKTFKIAKLRYLVMNLDRVLSQKYLPLTLATYRLHSMKRFLEWQRYRWENWLTHRPVANYW